MAQKREAIAPPPLTRPENGIPVYTILTCLSIVKGGGTATMIHTIEPRPLGYCPARNVSTMLVHQVQDMTF